MKTFTFKEKELVKFLDDVANDLIHHVSIVKKGKIVDVGQPYLDFHQKGLANYIKTCLESALERTKKEETKIN